MHGVQIPMVMGIAFGLLRGMLIMTWGMEMAFCMCVKKVPFVFTLNVTLTCFCIATRNNR